MKRQKNKLMNDLYGDSSEGHEACPSCGFCMTCGDCEKLGCGSYRDEKKMRLSKHASTFR